MPKALTKTQRAVMIWLSKGWKAYTTHGDRVEVNGKPVGTKATMDVLEAAGLVQREGVAAWCATPAGKEWRGTLDP